ncbi:MAG: thioesterase [Candidatus Marinimicrobia bacterium]|mgnify:FL=1|jgi:hypothetical protein|nr:thioesterase [Candidatus Neomarinimicrobiota bacterium]
MNETQKNFCSKMTNWFLFKAYSIQKLPLAFLTGFKILKLDESKCITSVKYSYLNKNPFRSTFWAVLGMAAELSTGAYALLATKGKEESVAVILVETHAEFVKKATGSTTFTCSNWFEFDKAVARAIETGEPQTAIGRSIGSNSNGETIALFEFTWSFKIRDQPTPGPS